MSIWKSAQGLAPPQGTWREFEGRSACWNLHIRPDIGNLHIRPDIKNLHIRLDIRNLHIRPDIQNLHIRTKNGSPRGLSTTKTTVSSRPRIWKCHKIQKYRKQKSKMQFLYPKRSRFLRETGISSGNLPKPFSSSKLRTNRREDSISYLELTFSSLHIPVSYTHLTLPTICSV